MPEGVDLLARADDDILSPEALAFVARLYRELNPTRIDLLGRRAERQAELDAGALLDFLPETSQIRERDWRLAPVAPDLADRRVDSWLRGVGAAAIDNLMEEVATSEISRSQLWQWVRHRRVSRQRVLDEVARTEAPEDAKDVFTEVALGEDFVEFLMLPAYERLTVPE